MKNLKNISGDFRCPQCGASDYDIDDEGRLLCIYCNSKAAFSIKELAENDSDGFISEKLAKRLALRADALNEERGECKRLLLAAKKYADPKKLLNFSIISLAASAFFLFVLLCAYSTNDVPAKTIGILCAVFVSLFLVCVGLFLFAFFKNRYARKKYSPLVAYYAERTARLDAELDIYIKAISILTK